MTAQYAVFAVELCAIFLLCRVFPRRGVSRQDQNK